MMKMKQAGRDERLDMIPALDLTNGFRLIYEGGSGDRHRVRLSRSLPGVVSENTLTGILDEFRLHRQSLPGGGVLAMAFWLTDSRSTYDLLIGASDGE